VTYLREGGRIKSSPEKKNRDIIIFGKVASVVTRRSGRRGHGKGGELGDGRTFGFPGGKGGGSLVCFFSRGGILSYVLCNLVSWEGRRGPPGGRNGGGLLARGREKSHQKEKGKGSLRDPSGKWAGSNHRGEIETTKKKKEGAFRNKKKKGTPVCEGLVRSARGPGGARERTLFR